MAIVSNNVITSGLSGMLREVVFRNVRGKTVVSSAPRPPQTESPGQKAGRDRFREATVFAKACMQDPKKKEYYWGRAHKLKLPNAYTAAITDFLRKPKVAAVKHKGQRMFIFVEKKGFSLAAVDVIVSDATGSISTTYNAAPIHGQWNGWEVQLPFVGTQDQEITIVAKDNAGNICKERIDSLTARNQILI